jgi:hypothetical protein
MYIKNLLSVVAVALLVTLGGCSTLEYVPIERAQPETLRTQLEVGDNVIVRFRSGDQRQFRIRALEPDAIVGRDERIAYKDIDRIDVKTVDYEGTAKTALAFTALAAVYIASFLIEAELDE